MTKPIALIILDGWGINDDCTANAVCQAQTPYLHNLVERFPTSYLEASGLSVGLPAGQMGNSEVGHLNIGAGRVVYQDLTRISKSIADGDFFTNPVLLEGLAKIRKANGALHLPGLLSDGGVHSHNTHLYALIDLAKQQGIDRVFVHAFLDGRDTPPRSGAAYLADLEAELQNKQHGRVATVIGRYFAMDRDNRWDRVERAWKAMVHGEGLAVRSSAEAIDSAYAADQSDEFVEPRIIHNGVGPIGRIGDGDGIIFFNFRADRAREITRALALADFDSFDRPAAPKLSSYVCLTDYDETFGLPIAYAAENYPNILGEVIAKNQLKQLRIAETEKYAHVTFFFNGGMEAPFPGEDRALIPSPKEVSTYDQKPAMSALEVTAETVRRIESGNYDLIILNYANPDMVGHTGILDAAIVAMETVDRCVGRVVEAVHAAGGAVLITADHGNCEQMADASGAPHTAHTANRVPLILADPNSTRSHLQPGILADLAPTILRLMNLDVPPEMTGKNLLAD